MWEYNIIENQSYSRMEEDIDLLNSLGKEGWELIAVERTEVIDSVIFYFKRKIDNQ